MRARPELRQRRLPEINPETVAAAMKMPLKVPEMPVMEAPEVEILTHLRLKRLGRMPLHSGLHRAHLPPRSPIF